MKIDITGAMEKEAALLRDRVENRQIISLGGYEICTGRSGGTEATPLKPSIGKVAVALGTALLLEHYKPDMIINAGSIDSLAPTLKMGNIVVPDKACCYDVDVTAFGYEYGRLPGCPASFKANNELIAAAEVCIAGLNLSAIRGPTVSGDIFINGFVSLMKIHHNLPRVTAVRAGATAIAHVYHNFSIPFTVMRAISNVTGQQSHLSFDKFLTVAAKQSNLIAKSLVQELVHS